MRLLLFSDLHYDGAAAEALVKKSNDADMLVGDGREIDGVAFFGIGGGVLVTPFGGWSFDFSEQEAEKLLSGCPADCVLVSHSPPQGAVDVSSSGRSLGSLAVRRAIELHQSQLVVCGDVHASAGRQAMIGRAPVVNAGPQGVFWELAT